MRAWIWTVAVLGVIASAAFAAVDGKGLADPDEKVRSEAGAKLLEAGASAVPASLTAMDGDNPTAAKTAKEALFKLVQAAAGGPQDKEIAAALASELGRKHRPATRQEICENLAFLGPEPSAIAALTRGLADQDIQDAARRALTRIPGPEATGALVGAIKNADDKFKVAIIDALGEKGDAAAATGLTELTGQPSESVSHAAWRALARIGSPDSLPVFSQAVKEKKDLFVTGLLFDYTDTLLAAGKLQQADTVLKLRKEAGPIEGLDKCRLLRAHARLGTPESISLILGGLDSTDPQIRGAAFEAAGIVPGTEVTRVITQKMNAAKGAAKIELLQLLGKRGAQMDERTVMLMYMAMLDKDDAVKIACIRAMQEAKITSTVPTLLNLVRGPAGPVADACEEALSRIPGATVTTQIVEAMPTSTPEGRARLLKVLQFRGDLAALPAVLGCAADPDARVREAAFDCLGRFGAEEAFDTLLAAFDGQPGPDRDAAERAMAALKSDVITARLLSGYFSSTEEQKPSMLRVLAGRQLEAIDALLLSESRSPDELIREAAIDGLARRAKPSTASALLEAARTGPAAITARALTGYLNVATTIEEKEKSAAGPMYIEAFKLAKDDDQKKTALLGIGRVGEPSKAVVDALLPLMKQGPLKDEAAMALAGVASRMPQDQKDRAVELLRRVVDDSGNADARNLAVGHLRELGVQVNSTRD